MDCIIDDMNHARRSHFRSQNLNRREFLALAMGGAGTVLACACGGVVGAVLLARRRGELQAAPPPFAPTSAANRADLQKRIAKPAIVPRADWGALPPNHDAENEKGFYSDDNLEGWRVYTGDLRDTYRTLVIHHSVTDQGNDLATLLDVQRLHREDRGWADVAYHFFIGKGGTVYEGRPMEVRGTHVAGYNTGSLGVCFLGNYAISAPTAEQLAAASSLAAWLAVRLQLTHIAGHRSFNSETICPGDNLMAVLPALAEAAGLQIGTEGYSGPQPTAEATETSYQPTCTCHV